MGGWVGERLDVWMEGWKQSLMDGQPLGITFVLPIDNRSFYLEE